MIQVFNTGRGVECWLIDGEYWVYGVTRDPRVLPSEAMARAFAGAA